MIFQKSRGGGVLVGWPSLNADLKWRRKSGHLGTIAMHWISDSPLISEIPKKWHFCPFRFRNCHPDFLWWGGEVGGIGFARRTNLPQYILLGFPFRPLNPSSYIETLELKLHTFSGGEWGGGAIHLWKALFTSWLVTQKWLQCALYMCKKDPRKSFNCQRIF